jgi:Na+/H+-dicarboxylate symporter
MFKQTYPRTLASIDAIMRDVKAELERLKLPRKNLVHALLLTEECTAALIENVSQRSDEPVEVAVRKRFGDISVRITVAGEECDPTLEVPLGDGTDQQDRDVQAVLRHRILRAYDSDLSHSHKNNRNVVTLTVKKNARKTLWFTLAAFVLAIIVGVALQLIGNESLITGLDANLLTPVRTMFLNALKMIMAPVVFFSLVNCISDLSNVSELGRMGGKTIAFYLFACVCAICIGIGVFYLIHPGAPVAEMPQTDAASLSQMEEVSILSTIVNIVPDNIASAVLEADMLQIIFIAVLCGIAVSVIGERGKILKEIFDACNELFLRITRMIISVVPIATFCAVTSLVATTGIGMLLSLVGVVGTFVLGLLILLVVYGLSILVLTRESPITFYRKYASCMLLAFTLSSSNATMPTTIQYCVNKLGVSPKVASFAIPLGSTINMDGSCVYLAVCSLFLAQMYGVDISGGTLLTLAISVMMLAIGAPGVTGAAFICLSTLVVQLGIPVESVTILMGIDQLLSMLRTTGNTTGDAVGAIVVAKTERLFDEEMYRNKSL